MTPLTLRTRLTLSYTAILAGLLAALGVVYYHTLRLSLDADATATLGEITSGMHGYLHFDGAVPRLAFDRADADEAAFVERASRYYQIYDVATGSRLASSTAIEPLGLHLTPEEVQAFRARPRTFDVVTDQGRIRFSNSLLASGTDTGALLQVGVSLAPMDAALWRFLRLLLWSAPAGLLVAAVVGRWMAGRALAPLARLATATRAVDVTALGARLPVRGAHDELDQVAEAFNELLARLEAAVGDMRQFSTALAHELRTPLAALRAEAELALTEGRSPDAHRRGLADQIEELDRLTRLINQLLTLARAEAGEVPLARDPVDLGAVSAMVVELLEPLAQAKGVTLAGEIAPGVMVTGDAAWLERLLLNLLDNALKFTPSGGRITVRVRRDDDRARLDVSDTGIGIDAASLPHVFERFYQADPARSRDAGGAGLGLSLVRWIALRHGATVTASSRPGEGSTFTVRFDRGRTTTSGLPSPPHTPRQ